MYSTTNILLLGVFCPLYQSHTYSFSSRLHPLLPSSLAGLSFSKKSGFNSVKSERVPQEK